MIKIDKKVIIGLSIFSIVAGILFCVLGTSLIAILFTILGALMVVGGIFSIIKLNAVGGIIGILIGALLIMGAWLFTNVLLIINGILLCIAGISGFAFSLRTNDAKKCILSILMLVLGVFFFINTEATANWIFFVIGALFILTGIIGLVLCLVPSKKGIKTVDVKEIK